jgi:FtsH-binding integral membrane protein
MQNEPEKNNLNRGRSAATKWLPMSAIGAAIPFVIGVVMRLPVEQVLISAAMTSALVFSGLWMQSYGRERQYSSAA